MNENKLHESRLSGRSLSSRPWYAVHALLLMASVGGCQQRAVNQLLGQWVGRPDTAAERTHREAEKYGEVGSSLQSDAGPVDPERVTDWERYDATVTLEFVDRQRIEMSLADDALHVSGKWQVISTSPIGCTIEVATDASAEPNESDQVESLVQRRFQIEFDERAGVCVGFTMMEVGADRQLGALYFRRPE